MSRANLKEITTNDEVDASAARPGASRTAVRWGIAGAVVSSGAWVVGLVMAGALVGFAESSATLQGQVLKPAVVLAGACGGCGLVVGAVVGVLRGGASRITAAVVWALGGTLIGVVGGGLSPVLVMAAGTRVPVEVSSGAAWAIAGLLAGLLGLGWNTRHRTDDADGRGDCWTDLRADMRWGIAGAVGVGGVWALALVVARWWIGVELSAPRSADELIEAVVVTVVSGVLWGLLVGAASGLFSRGPDRVGSAVARALIGAVAGASGGVLSSLLMAASASVLPAIVSSSLAWAVVGLVGGVVGSRLDRRRASRAETVVELDWSGDEPGEGELPPPERRPRLTFAPARPLLPLVAVSVACLVVVIVSPPSNLGWVVLAIGLQGLAAAWGIAGQERRIRELERRLREQKT